MTGFRDITLSPAARLLSCVVRRAEAKKHMEQLLLELLYRLEAIGERDESLFDTVVRDKMGEAVFFGFIKPRPGYVLPDEFGMEGDDNRLIRAALQTYIDDARALAPIVGVDTFHKRLATFQNLAVRTAEPHCNDYNDFFGWSPPGAFDAEGNVIRQS
jgi:hypothetical protein